MKLNWLFVVADPDDGKGTHYGHRADIFSTKRRSHVQEVISNRHSHY